jgi:DNA-binding XRE family transcriptional regulator
MTVTPAAPSGLPPLLDELRAARLPPPAERRAIRVAAGISQRRLARALGVCQRNVSNWESPTGPEPRPEHALAYRVALDALREHTRNQEEGNPLVRPA